MTKTLAKIGLNYHWALPYADQYMQKHNKNIEQIAEIGSRDALDGITLARRYKANVMIFEPDPYNILTCKKNIETQNLQSSGGGGHSCWK